jgi:hypothetical protein
LETALINLKKNCNLMIQNSLNSPKELANLYRKSTKTNTNKKANNTLGGLELGLDTHKDDTIKL